MMRLIALKLRSKRSKKHRPASLFTGQAAQFIEYEVVKGDRRPHYHAPPNEGGDLSNEDRTMKRSTNPFNVFRMLDNLPLHGVRVEVEERASKGLTIKRCHVGGARYTFDNDICTQEQGWEQYDVTEDASYFGIWLHEEKRLVACFAEGDFNMTIAHDDDAWQAERERLKERFTPAPAFVAYGLDPYTRTEVYGISGEDI